MAPFQAYDAVYISYMDRIIVLSRPSFLYNLRVIAKAELGLKCNLGRLALSYYSGDHKRPIRLADDAAVQGLWNHTTLSLRIMPPSKIKPTASFLGYLQYESQNICFAGPASLAEMKLHAREHFHIPASVNDIKIYLQDFTLGKVEIVDEKSMAFIGQRSEAFIVEVGKQDSEKDGPLLSSSRSDVGGEQGEATDSGHEEEAESETTEAIFSDFDCLSVAGGLEEVEK